MSTFKSKKDDYVERISNSFLSKAKWKHLVRV